MKKTLHFALAFLATFGLLRGVSAETRQLEMRTVDARVVRVKLDGVMEVRIRQGNVASLSITADKRYIADVSTAQSGDTLHIETEVRGFKLNPGSTRADLVLPNRRKETADPPHVRTGRPRCMAHCMTRPASRCWPSAALAAPSRTRRAGCSIGSVRTWRSRPIARACWKMTTSLTSKMY